MRLGRALALAAWTTLAGAVLPGAAAAQFLPAQPDGYLMTIDASDARALWVNPAGLARRDEASVGVDVAMKHSSLATRLSQYGVLLSSHHLAFGWSHNRLPLGTFGGGNAAGPPRVTNVYAIGIGLGDSVFSAGAAKRWYRGDARSSAWNVGTRAALSPHFDVAVDWRDIGSPIVIDTMLEETVVPAVGITLLGGRLRGAVEWHIAKSHWKTREIRTGWTVRVRERLAFSLRTDLTPGLGRLRTAIAAEWGFRRTRLDLFTSRQGVTDTETLGAGLVAASEPPRARRRR